MRFTLFAVACTTLSCTPSPPWWEQRVADSPCYRVDLGDGLDETSTTELNDTYACLNRQHHLDALAPTMAALSTSSPVGRPAGLELAHAVNEFTASGIPVFDLAGPALTLLQSEDRPLEPWLDLLLELSYGVPATTVRNTEFNLQHSLSHGLLTPLAQLIPSLSSTLRQQERNRWNQLTEPVTVANIRWSADFLLALQDHPDSDIASTTEQLLGDVGQLINATRSPDNDHYPSASGDSLRDVVLVYAGGNDPLLVRAAPELAELLADPILRDGFRDLIEQWESEGRLRPLFEQIHTLASIDATGGSLQAGEVSALHSFLRLLHDTNRSASCEVDLGFTTFELDVGNLALTTLQALVTLDPDTVQGGIGILSQILGWDLSQSLLNQVANSGICPVITTQVTQDLRAIDVIADENHQDLLVALIDLLQILKNGGENGNALPILADTISLVVDEQGVEPIEELVRDVHDTRFLDDVFRLLPLFFDPSANALPADAPDIDTLLATTGDLFVDSGDGVALERWQPLLAPILESESTWIVLGRTGTLLTNDQARLPHLLEFLPPLLDADPELETLTAFAPAMANPEVAEALLRLGATDTVAHAMLAEQGTSAYPEPPLAFCGRIITRGALEDIVAMIDFFLADLGE